MLRFHAEPSDGKVVIDRALALTADGRVVAEDDPEARTLLVGRGASIDRATAEKYGLVGKDAPAPEVHQIVPAETKRRGRPRKTPTE